MLNARGSRPLRFVLLATVVAIAWQPGADAGAAKHKRRAEPPPFRLKILNVEQKRLLRARNVPVRIVAREAVDGWVSASRSPVKRFRFRPGGSAVRYLRLGKRLLDGLKRCTTRHIQVSARSPHDRPIVATRAVAHMFYCESRQRPGVGPPRPGTGGGGNGGGSGAGGGGGGGVPALDVLTAPFPAPAGVAKQADFEPGMARRPDGTIWVAGSNFIERGADIWVSKDGGHSYDYVTSPFHETGYDVDMAAASEPDAQGKQAIYASNQTGDTGLGVSRDNGKTWAITHIGGVPEQDRPWVAADGACTLYASYYDPDVAHAWVDRYDTCSGAPVLGTRVPTLVTRVPDPYSAGASIFGGKIVVDTSPTSPYRHSVYIPTGGCAVLPDPSQIVFPPTPAVAEDCQALPVANSISISRDRGLTWKAVHIADAHTHEMSIWPDQMAVARDGTLYEAWGDQHNVYVARSLTGGNSWDRPVALPAPGSGVLPHVSAGPSGQVTAAWYVADRPGYANDKVVMDKAEWRLAVAHSWDAGRTWVTRVVPNLLYTGPVCTTTHFCNGPGKGASPFLENFGISMDPKTGLSSIAYADRAPEAGQAPAFIAYATETPAATP